MRFSLRKAVAVAAAVGVLVAFTGIAHADDIWVDGDTIADEQRTLSGEACEASVGVHSSVLPIALGIKRSGNSVNNTFKNGTTVTMSQLSTSNAAVQTVLPNAGQFILPATLPGWEASANGTKALLPGAAISVDTTGASVGGSVLGSIVHRASGTNRDDGAVQKDSTASPLQVTATVVDGDTALVEDCIAPTASITTPASGANYVSGAVVNSSFSCDDSVAGGGGAGDSGIPTGGCVGAATVDTSTLGSHTFVVNATDNAGNTGSASVSYNVIPNAPGTLTATANGATTVDLSWGTSSDHAAITKYVVFRKAAGEGAFSELAALDPVGAAGSTQTYSNTSLTSGTEYCYKVLARYTAASVNYDSAFTNESCATPVAPAATLTGTFGQPIDGNGVVNKGKIGRVIPVKLQVFNGTTEVENGTTPTVSAVPTGCDATSNSDVIETYAAGSSNSGFEFRWDTTGGHWIYNLDTSKLPGATANKCFTVHANVGGTSIASFLIQLTK